MIPKEKLIEVLEESDPPRSVLPNTRAQLKDNLLNSDFFQKGSFGKRLLDRPIIIGGGVILLVLLAFLIPRTIPRQISARELLARIEASYSQVDREGKTHYLLLRFASHAGEARSIIEEKWLDRRQGTFRVLVTDAQSGEILAHIISRKDTLYALPHSPWRYRAPGSRGKETFPSPLNRSSGHFQTYLEVRFDTLLENAGIKQVRVSFIRNPFDFMVFSKFVPLDMLRRMKSDPRIVYAGSKVVSSGGEKMEVLKRYIPGSSFSLRLAYYPELKHDVDELVQKLESGETIPPSPSLLKGIFEAREIRLVPLKTLEIVRIRSRGPRLYQLIYSLRDGTEQIQRLELTILDEQILDYDPAIFDHRRFDLPRIREFQ